MKAIKIFGIAALLCLTACNAEDINNITTKTATKEGEIICTTEHSVPVSRAYFENASAGLYTAKWAEEDQLALSFDHSESMRIFTLHSGANSPSATFHGPLPDSYSSIEAIYPSSVFNGRNSEGIEVYLPSSINYIYGKMLAGTMPMYASGTANTLNFYNLASVIKLSVTGQGLLKRVRLLAPDGSILSGKGTVSRDSDGIPTLTMTDGKAEITVEMGSTLLNSTITDIFIPIPACTYENGLTITFEFEGKTEGRDLKGPLHFERSIMRPVAPYQMAVPFDLSKYERQDNEIWYRTSVKQGIKDDADFGSKMLSHSYNAEMGLGLISTESPIVRIEVPFLDFPEEVTAIYLPETLQEIGVEVFAKFGIEEFTAPPNLKLIGLDGFYKCHNLKRVKLNDGIESIGLECFGDCPNLEYVYLPKSLEIIGAYAFRESTGHLDHWEGDCIHIDPDRHTLYATTAYGIVNTSHIQIDVVAGCNLREYTIPQNVIYLQNYVFSGLVELRKLIAHENVENFAGWIFGREKSKVETIICYAPAPPKIEIAQEADENGILRPIAMNSLIEILVPKESIELYRKSEYWAPVSDKFKPLP